MRASLRVLSDDEVAQVHERTLAVLQRSGVRVDSEACRRILMRAGAAVDDATRVVRFPLALVEEALRLAPKVFTLAGRRPGWQFALNAGDCTILSDGGATQVVDARSGELRPGDHGDWLAATRLLDAIDDVGLYWWTVEYGWEQAAMAGWVGYFHELFLNFSKHVQDSFTDPAVAPWLLEVLEVVFGGRDAVRRGRPFSYLFTPASPLVIDRGCAETWLALRGWGIPVAVMPMPLMGATAPASLAATIVQANAETLATLCLVQAAEPGTPFIYAPVLAVMEPHTGRYAAGAVEASVMAVAGTQLARSYGLPVEASGCTTDHFVPSVQAAYEKATTSMITALSWPDILIGPGLLGGATVLSLEQLVIDVEVFRMCRRAAEGVRFADELWLDDAHDRVGHGGTFLAESATRRNVRTGEWCLSRLGLHDSHESWLAVGKPDVIDQARECIDQLLASHRLIPFSEDQETALLKLEEKARRSS